MVHCLGCFVPEADQSVLVHNQRMGEHVTSKKSILPLEAVNQWLFTFTLQMFEFFFLKLKMKIGGGGLSISQPPSPTFKF